MLHTFDHDWNHEWDVEFADGNRAIYAGLFLEVAEHAAEIAEQRGTRVVRIESRN